MGLFVFALRLICHICKGLCLRCKDVHIYSPAFLFNLPTPFLVRRYYKSLCVYADVLPILHSPSRRVCDLSRQAEVLSANHSCFTGPRTYRGQAAWGYERRCNGEKQM